MNGLKPYVELLTLVGLNSRTMEPTEIYLSAGRVIHDRELTSRCEAYIVNGVLPSGTREKVIQSMGPDDLQQLKERIQR